jgi:hypothetical protein
MSRHANSTQNARPSTYVTGLRVVLLFSVFSFLFHFAWEVLQAPLFARMATDGHWQATLMCLEATFGDLGIALAAFIAAAARDRSLAWFMRPSAGSVVTYIATGVLFTTAFEWHAVYWANRWAYSDLMPIVPFLGIGLAPLLQWLALPPVVLHVLKRYERGGPIEPGY